MKLIGALVFIMGLFVLSVILVDRNNGDRKEVNIPLLVSGLVLSSIGLRIIIS